MPKTYTCPKCGHEVPLKDINVAKDIMLCMACGETSSFSEVKRARDDAQREDEGRKLLSGKPPKHLKVETDPTTGGVRLIYHRLSKQAIFLVPFTTVWAGFSLTVIYGSQIMKGEFDWRVSLFGLPFLIGSIALISTCCYMLFGKQVLTLACGKGMFFRGVGSIGRRKRFAFDRTTRVGCGSTDYAVNGISLSELRLSTPGQAKTIRICVGMDEDALDYAEAVIKREISRA